SHGRRRPGGAARAGRTGGSAPARDHGAAGGAAHRRRPPRSRGTPLRRDRRGPRPSGQHGALASAPSAAGPQGEAGALPTMSCHDARELFSARADDALTAPERAALDAHLASCAECRREWERFRATVALLHAVEHPRAPVGFVDRVLGATSRVPRHRRVLRALFLPWRQKLPMKSAPAPIRARSVPAEVRGAPADAAAPAPAREAARESAKLSALRPTAADLSGHLVVKDRDAAAGALAELATRAGGREITRRATADATVMELVIPRAAWAEFARGLARLGTWSPEREPAELPAEIRVALRIIE